MSMIVHLY